MLKSRSNWYWQIVIVSLLSTGSAIASSFNCAFAQITPDDTLGNESSIVTPSDNINGQAGTQIDGGAIRGENQFHSFDEFSVPTGSAAYFNNPSEVNNIINRVTGGNVSNIDGLIKANGTANLFLINPNGIVFGEGARLDIGGSFIGSTASSVKFADGSEFSATNPQSEPLLSVNIPVGLQFGGNPGKIQVRGNGEGIREDATIIDTNDALRVPSDRTLALVGGDLEFSGATLKTAGGRIELGSVADSNLVSLASVDKGFALAYQGVENFRDIQLSQKSVVDASGEGGGDIQVQGRQIRLTGGSQIEASTLGTKPGGTLNLNASDLIELSDAKTALSTAVYPEATGRGGEQIINTERLVIQDEARVSTRTLDNSKGDGGNMTIDTNQLIMKNGGRVLATTLGEGNGSELQINASDLIELTGVSPDGDPPAGLFAQTEGTGDAGNLTIDTERLIVKDGAQVFTGTEPSSQGNGGNLQISASDSVELSGVSLDRQFPAGLFNQTEGAGDTGNLTIDTERLIVKDGAQVSTSTPGSGNSGKLQVNASSLVHLSGVSLDGEFSAGLFTRTEGTGDAGDLTINTGAMKIADGAIVDARTTNTGKGGNITMKVDTLEALRGGQVLASAFENSNGNAGNITLDATDKVVISDSIPSIQRNRNGNSGLFVRSLGLGDAGEVKVTASSIELSNGGEITAETTSGQGGNIGLQVKDSLLLRGGSKITSTAGLEGAGGDGGNITIDSPLIVGFPRSNSDITANAFEGKGGNINIFANAIFGLQERKSTPPNQTNDIDASSESGLNGNISIDILDLDPSKGLIELPVVLANPEPLQTCQAKRGQDSSSFTNIGRGGLPSGTEEISSNTVWEDWRSPHRDENNFSDSEPITSSTISKPKRVIEAQGWIITPNNRVMLTTQPATITPSSYEQKSFNCYIR